MASSPIPINVCFERDGQWHFKTLMCVALVCAEPTPPPPAFGQGVVARCNKKAKKRTPPPPLIPTSDTLAKVLESLCQASLEGCTALTIERNDLVLRTSRIESLSSCRVDDITGERFGRFEHWTRLIEATEGKNIVV